MQADRDFCKDTIAKRLDGWMAWMAPNVVAFGGPGYKGLEEVRVSMKEHFENPGTKLSWEPTKAEMFPGGTMGYTTGKFTFSADGGKTMIVSGTYITVWQKQKDGSWKVVADGGAPDGGQ
jgi:ketosteroid isomerase-like protein